MSSPFINGSEFFAGAPVYNRQRRRAIDALLQSNDDWNEADHPREPAGSPGGGQFAGGGGGGGGEETLAQLAERIKASADPAVTEKHPEVLKAKEWIGRINASIEQVKAGKDIEAGGDKRAQAKRIAELQGKLGQANSALEGARYTAAVAQHVERGSPPAGSPPTRTATPAAPQPEPERPAPVTPPPSAPQKSEAALAARREAVLAEQSRINAAYARGETINRRQFRSERPINPADLSDKAKAAWAKVQASGESEVRYHGAGGARLQSGETIHSHLIKSLRAAGLVGERITRSDAEGDKWYWKVNR